MLASSFVNRLVIRFDGMQLDDLQFILVTRYTIISFRLAMLIFKSFEDNVVILLRYLISGRSILFVIVLHSRSQKYSNGGEGHSTDSPGGVWPEVGLGYLPALSLRGVR